MIWVDWLESALDELADLWVAATSEERELIGNIVEQILRDLRVDPLEVGESRRRDLRLVIRLPVALWFRVTDDGRQVRIYHIRRIRRRE